jgi:hypothetical protein
MQVMFVSIVSYRIDATYLQEDKALDERDSIGQTDKELERPHRKALTSERCPKTKVQVHGRITVSTLACQLDGKHLPYRR